MTPAAHYRRRKQQDEALRLLRDLAAAGLLWTGAQHDAMKTPPRPALVRVMEATDV